MAHPCIGYIWEYAPPPPPPQQYMTHKAVYFQNYFFYFTGDFTDSHLTRLNYLSPFCWQYIIYATGTTTGANSTLCPEATRSPEEVNNKRGISWHLMVISLFMMDAPPFFFILYFCKKEIKQHLSTWWVGKKNLKKQKTK